MQRRISPEVIKFVIFLLFITIFFLGLKVFNLDKDKIRGMLSAYPLVYSAFLFLFLYVVGTLFIWYIKDPLKIIGAFLFGAYGSTLLIYIAEIINAVVLFHISSFLGRDFVEKKLKGKARRFYEKIERFNMVWLFLLRAVPIIPYRFLDLGFGLSYFPFRKYILAVIIGSPPRIFWIQFILAGMREFSIESLAIYFLENRLIFSLCVVYVIITIVVGIFLRNKLR